MTFVIGMTIIFLFIRLHGDGYDIPVTIAESKGGFDFWKADRSFVEISGIYNNNPHDWDLQNVRPEGAKDSGQKVFTGWGSQWHLGQKKSKQEGSTNIRTDPSTEDWIWMTNVYLSDGDCGPAWELMYTHKFPGIITHTSLSRRLIQDPQSNKDLKGVDTTSTSATSRESIRLAVVYKTVQDEKVTYYSRVYHLGYFQNQGCKLHSENCQEHESFLSFDYVLPGSTPIKDFTLEHDKIIYSRIDDTVLFRSIKLPKLELESTSFENPHVLTSGTPGSSIDCKKKRLVPFRRSYLDLIPNGSESSEDRVMIGQVLDNEHEHDWTYRIESEALDNDASNKKWNPDTLDFRFNKVSIQEPDTIDEEPHTYGVPIQKPFSIRSINRNSVHIPVANRIVTLETTRTLYSNINPDDSASKDDGGRENHGSSKPPQLKHKPAENQVSRNPWSVSFVEDTSSTNSMEAEYGVISDGEDVLVLKTTRNALLILKRSITSLTQTGEHTKWRLSMVMNDEQFNFLESPMDRKLRGVKAMKIVKAPVVVNTEHENDPSPVPRNEDPDSHDQSLNGQEITENYESMTEMHNILVIVYGDGRTYGYDLDHVEGSSPTVQFIEERLPVVIGMIIVVIAFVINELR
ncbi:hypothetical protein BGZ76_011701 [Entomortierella beljakovae]|nr:hypothetical protein BGZ76_011701 [Entomortierella beljakovae]